MIIEISTLGRDILFTDDTDEVGPRRLQVCRGGVVFRWMGRGERGGGGGGRRGGAEGAQVVACQR